MKLNKYFSTALSLLVIILFSGFQDSHQKEKIKSIDARVDSVISLMNLEEKIGQLNQLSYGIGWGPTIKPQVPDEYRQLIREGKIGSFLNAIGAKFTRELQKIAVEESRMKIPLLFGLDVIHGVKTTFPVPLAEVSSWDPELVELSAKYQALEASAMGIHWTFAPMVDIARDPRWGRIVEGAGEDTYLGSVMSFARVKGFQGDLSNKNILACAKHFASYGGAEGGRDYNTVDISERTLRDVYLPPFKAAVDAGVETFMCSFNEISGIPSSANNHLLTTILRDEWNFEGFVVSDWNSVGELINHGVAADLKEASMLGLNSGVDMDMESRGYINYLKDLVNENKISEETINQAVRRILKIKFKLGLFDNPYKYCNENAESEIVMNEELQDAALKVAQRSIVLLKNENNLLPLSSDNSDIKTIAVIGPLSNSKKEPLGSWFQFGDTSDVISLYEGIKNKVSGKKDILFSEGCSITGNDKNGFDDAIEIANKSDVIIIGLGEEGNMSGEARSRSSLDLPGVQDELLKEICKTGKPVVVVLMNGRPLSVEWISDNCPAILEAWFLGIKSGEALADVIFGDYNPSGKLPVTFPRRVGQVPIYYNHKYTGRPGSNSNSYTSKYIDLPLTPLYPFGFGLSYTKFDYSNLQLDKKKYKSDEKINISVEVKNSGERDGEEVVQLYVQDLVGSVTRPVKELKRFEKIFLKKGETKKVEFTLNPGDLSFYNKELNFVTEPGMFKVFAGTNSVDLIENSFEIIE